MLIDMISFQKNFGKRIPVLHLKINIHTYLSSKIFLIVESFAIKLCSVACINIGARTSNLAKKYFKLCCLVIFNIHPP